MNSFIETLNHSGGTFLDFAWPIAWQSGLLVAALLAFDFLFRRQIRASVRYAVWLVVLVKLILPPTLALPTSPAWWLLHQPPMIQLKPQIQNYIVSYDDESLPPASLNSLPAYVPPKPAITPAAWLLALSAATSIGLLAWLLIRWWQITRRVSRAKTSERLTAIAAQTRLLVGVRACPPVKLTADTMSPAVCGLFHPAILIPQTLAENFSDEQLRAVLLHELIHLRRRDVWLNFLQSLLQIVYWWHPLVWLANARIRRVREEAVDDAVMLALAGGAEAYAPTLLQVARLALNRPLVSLGVVGIMESRSALRQRIERLVDFRPPRRAGLTMVSIFGILAFTAVAVPMGGAPGATEEQALRAHAVPVPSMVTNTSPSRNQQRLETIINNKPPSTYSGQLPPASNRFSRTYEIKRPMNQASLEKTFLDAGVKMPPTCLFDSDNGLLMVTGTREQQVLVLRMVLKLNGFAPKDSNGMIAEFARELDAVPESDSVSTNLFMRTFKVSTDYFPAALRKQISLPANGNANISMLARMLFTQLGADMELPKGKTVFYNAHLSLLFVKATEPDLDIIERAIQTLSQAPAKGQSWPLLDATQGTFSSAADNELFVRSFKLDQVAFSNALQKQTGLPIKNAADISRAARNYFSKSGVDLDLPPGKSVFYNDHLGLLFVKATESDLDTIGCVVQSLSQTAPTSQSGLQFSEAGVKELPEPEVVTRSGREASRLDEISIPLASEGSAESSSQNNPAARLFLRGFKVDTQTFLASLGLKRSPADFGENSPAADYPALRKFVTDLGVNLESPSGKTISFNEKRGLLYVKATESDLDTIGRVLLELPPQLHIKARFLEVPKGTFAGLAKAINIPNQSNQLVGILTSENLQMALRNLQARPDVEELAEPGAVTLSGRRTQMRATELITVVTNFSLQENGTNTAVIPQTTQVETGPSIDVIPHVLADGYTINLTAMASLTNFLGYDKPPDQHISRYDTSVHLPVVLPVVCVQQAIARLNLWDNQTVVLGNLPKHYYSDGKEVSPEPAYLAQQGKKQAKSQPDEMDKELIVFVTVTIIDPVGNRIFSENEMPFAKTGIPPQPQIQEGINLNIP